MTRLLHVARTSLLSLAGRPEAEDASRPAPDPLAALWHFLEMPLVMAVCLGLVGLLVLSAIASPSLYLQPDNTFGWPTPTWPALAQRLAALALLGSTPWGQVILSLLLVLSAVRAAGSARLALEPPVHPGEAPSRPGAVERARFYCEADLPGATRKARLALACLGYRLRPQENAEAAYLASADSTHARARLAAAIALAVLALLGLLAPKVTAAEVVDLAPGQPQVLQAGLLLAASDQPAVSAQVAESGAIRPVWPRRPTLIGSTLVVWHGSGPALSVAPATDDPAGYGLFIPFLPDQSVKYITVPGTGASARVSLTPTSNGAEFEVQPLTKQGQPADSPHPISEATVLPVEDTELALSPASYQVVSALSAPLWWPGLLAGLVCLAALGLAVLFSGPPLTVALSERAGIVTIEVERHASEAPHDLWQRMLRLVLR
jgi:hypothetical protein